MCSLVGLGRCLHQLSSVFFRADERQFYIGCYIYKDQETNVIYDFVILIYSGLIVPICVVTSLKDKFFKKSILIE